MTSNFFNISTYSRFNLAESESDIHLFVKKYKERIKNQLNCEEAGTRNPFKCFTTRRLTATNLEWLEDDENRFMRDTANSGYTKKDFLVECGFICSMVYTPDGENVVVGHSSGMIQLLKSKDMEAILNDYEKAINHSYGTHKFIQTPWYPMFYKEKRKNQNQFSWVKENNDRFLKDTPNKVLYYRWFYTEMGAITTLAYSPNGSHIIVGHSSGLIQMRHGSTGVVLCTLRNIQFPPKPIYALEYSKQEERICYAACMDGAVYRIEIPPISAPVDDPPAYCIRVDPALENMTMQFYGTPGISSYSTPFITQRVAPLSIGLTADDTKLAIGYNDASIKIYDLETQESIMTYKVHKLRLQFIPKKLQRMHFGQVCALRCHPQKPNVFASGAWDRTLRIWDVRCKVGCVMTFEGVNICSDSIDLNRDHCIAGSWQPTEALSVWDIVARKKINVIRVQNRRPNVDGEYIYACRFWNSADYNRKGKYGIIGGSGTNSVEVINLHNRYITCSYPAPGTVLAVASYQDRIAFGGTSTAFNVVKFFDPKHEKEKYKVVPEPDYDYKNAVSIFDTSADDFFNPSIHGVPSHTDQSHKSLAAVGSHASRSRHQN